MGKFDNISEVDLADLWWNKFTRMWYVLGRHAAVDLTPTIQCRQCGQDYDWYGGDRDGEIIVQGHDLCAWSVQKDGRWMIHCGYGSEFDLSEFWYIKDYPEKSVDGICDWCIRRMLRDGVIIDSGKTCTIEYDGYK